MIEHRYKGNNEWVDANLGAWLEFMAGNQAPHNRLHEQDAETAGETTT